MKILVTGSNGFIGKNLIAQLKNIGYNNILECDINTPKQLLNQYLQECNFIFHLAGVNRSENEKDFYNTNINFTRLMLEKLDEYENRSPIVVSSSIQVENTTPYGKSKKEMEDIILKYGENTNSKVYIFRLPNVYGKWCKPNYNSVIATFCYNIWRDIPIVVSDESKSLQLVYIDTVVNDFIDILKRQPALNCGLCKSSESVTVTLGEIADKLYYMYHNRSSLMLNAFETNFDKSLFSTYMSYAAEDDFSYPLVSHTDIRGSFTEFIKCSKFGQICVSKTEPGVVRGNHWHNSKVEKILITEGTALMKFKKIGEQSTLSYIASGEKLEVIDIPPGYTHNIKNIGDTQLIMIIWSNDVFDPKMPDTYALEV